MPLLKYMHLLGKAAPALAPDSQGARRAIPQGVYGFRAVIVGGGRHDSRDLATENIKGTWALPPALKLAGDNR